MPNQTYGQATGDLITQLLKMAQGAGNFNPVSAGTKVGQGAMEGFLNTEVGQNPTQAILAKIADKTLTKRWTEHAEQTPDSVLLAHAAPLYASSNKQNNQMDNANSQTGQAQSNGQYMGAPQPQSNEESIPAQNPAKSSNPMEIIGQLLSERFKQANDAVMAPTNLANAQAAHLGQETKNMTPEGALALKTSESKTPLNTYEKASLAAGGFQAQASALNNQLERMNQDQTNLESLIKTYEGVRGPLNKMTGGPSKEMKQLQNQWSTLQKAKAGVHTRLAKLYGQQPDFTPSGDSSSSGSLPSRDSAPKGAKGWDTEKGAWVY